jgi:hypothetical protein
MSTDPPTPEETPLGKTDGYGGDIRGHATTRGYRRVKQLLLIPRRSRPEEQGSALQRIL